MASSVSTNDLKAFHAMDCKLYRRLVVDSGRDLVRCMHAIALWIFLEEMGYPNIVQKLLATNDAVVNFVLDEAVYCLSCLESLTPPTMIVGVSDLPWTQELMGSKAISAWLVYQQRICALSRVKQTVDEAFLRAFDDTVQEVVGKRSA